MRKASSFRDWIKADGSTPFAPEAGRYVLYVALACPWAHRTLLMRKLKGLEDVIETVVVHHHLGPGGWRFLKEDEEDEWASADTVNGCARLGDRTFLGFMLRRYGTKEASRRQAKRSHFGCGGTFSSLPSCQSRVHRQLHGAHIVGQETQHDREQRVVRGWF